MNSTTFAMRPERIKRTAQGQWPTILERLAPTLAPALRMTGRHVPCPIHGGTDGFRLFTDVADTGGGICNTCGSHADGFALLGWVNGWGFGETLREVEAVLGLRQPGRSLSARRQAKPTDNADHHAEAKRRRQLRQVWDSAGLIEWLLPNAVTRYLRHRGLADILDQPPQNLRLHACLDHWTKASNGKPGTRSQHPAMLARVQNRTGEAVTLHRSYLTKDGGKAKVDSPRKLMQPVRKGATMGAAVRLYPAAETLAVAEGIETALAVRVATGLPVWAALTVNGMQALELPDTVQHLLIYADHDASDAGQHAANALADRQRTEGRNVSIFLPPTVGTDWLDVLNDQGAA